MGNDDTLPFLPPSFSTTNQLLVVKTNSLQHKRGLFISSMCCITDAKNNHQGYNPIWFSTIERKHTCLFGSLTTAQVLPDSSKITMVLVTTLDQLSKNSPFLIKAVQEFLQYQDPCKIADLFSEVATHVKMFISALDSIGWRNEWRSQEVTELRKLHPLNRASLLALSTIHEIASELLGESKLQEALKDLNAVLTTMESGIYVNRRDFIIMHWLTSLVPRLHSPAFLARKAGEWSLGTRLLVDNTDGIRCIDLQLYKDSLKSIRNVY